MASLENHLRGLSISSSQLKPGSSPVAGRPAVPLPTSAALETSAPTKVSPHLAQRRDQQPQQQRTTGSASSSQRSAIAQQLVQQSLSNSQQSLYRALSQQQGGQAAAIVTQTRVDQQRISPQWQQQGKLQRVVQGNSNGNPGKVQKPPGAQGQQQQQFQGVAQQQSQSANGTVLTPQQQALLAQQQPVRSQQKPLLSQQHILAQQQQQHAMLTQYQQHVAGERAQERANERTYMNVQPVAMLGRSRTRREGEGGLDEPRCTPAIPCSQEVKHKQEPLYATILQGPGTMPEPGYEETNGLYANYAPASLYSNYSNYSELDVLRSSDSHCSAEEEHTEGLPSLGDSPVSSSYSELQQAHILAAHQQRAAFSQQQQQQQQQGQQGQNHPDGLYEPVVPPKVAQGAVATAQRVAAHFKTLSNSSDSDYFGCCVACGSRIVGEGTGCSAMGRLYHVQCFACSQCSTLLLGQPFYGGSDNKPLCQTCYTNTLEKCCKCSKPILDRILRATGKPYHPSCFTCVVCQKSLDGIPFTVDATNQIHCIEDFHRRFAPRCSVCQQPIMPSPGQEEQETVRVVALDRSFHIECYRCVDCNLLLSSEEQGRGCYPLDNDVLCKQCNTRRIQALTQQLAPDRRR